MYLRKSVDSYSINQTEGDCNVNFWTSCEEEKWEVVSGCAAVKIKKGLMKKGEEIYNIDTNRVEVLGK